MGWFVAVHQFYEARVNDEFVLRGNTGLLKCIVPSFVADFVQVISWHTDDGSVFLPNVTNSDDGNVSEEYFG